MYREMVHLRCKIVAGHGKNKYPFPVENKVLHLQIVTSPPILVGIKYKWIQMVALHIIFIFLLAYVTKKWLTLTLLSLSIVHCAQYFKKF